MFSRVDIIANFLLKDYVVKDVKIKNADCRFLKNLMLYKNSNCIFVLNK